MDIEAAGHKTKHHATKKANHESSQHPALWFEEPSEVSQKLAKFHRQCNEFELGSKSTIGEPSMKVSIDSRIS
jgi:hypothetical protein